MKKILILTASTGQGHNQAAKALKTLLDSDDCEITIVDFIKEDNKLSIYVVEGGYDYLVKMHPEFYGMLYRVSDNRLMENALSTALKPRVSRLGRKIINKYSPDLVIGTHPFAVACMKSLKKTGYIKVPFVQIVTDFVAHQTYLSECVDYYITSSELSKSLIVQRGIPSNKIMSFGIPIDKKFLDNVHNDTNSTDDLFNILLMGGSMGLKEMKATFMRLLNMQHPAKITVVCGRNKKLYNQLIDFKNTYTGNKEIIVLGYTNEIPSLMRQADILIGKPGGITVTEALSQKLPIVIPFAIPGQEEYNRELLSITNIAICVDTLSHLPTVIDYLVKNPSRLKSIRLSMSEFNKSYSMDELKSFVLSLISNNIS